MNTDIYTTSQVADHLRSSIDWRRLSKLIKALGPQLNSEQLRFLKARIIEVSTETYSNGTLEYVSQNGCDFLIKTLGNIRLEMKFTNGAIYTSKNIQSKFCTIKLMNSMGTNTHATLPTHYADFLMCVGSRGAILFDKNTLITHSVSDGDGIKAKIPTSLGIIIADPTIMDPTDQQEVDFIKQLDASVIAYANSIL